MTAQYSHLRCIACEREHQPDTVRFSCEACGDLLQVVLDTAALAKDVPDLKQRFSDRRQSFVPREASGVWRYRELVLPDIASEAIVALPEGNTGLYQRKGLASFLGLSEVYLKHEGENPTLSFKDRGMTAGVSWAKHVGAKRIACASTGDTSAAMACYAAAAGIPGVVLLPDAKVSVEQLAQPICYGAQVLALATDFDGCMSLVKQLTADGAIYLLNSMNPFRIEGQKTIGIETIDQLGWHVPDWFVIPVGNAGNISALGKGLHELKELGLIDRVPRLAGIQSAQAAPLYQAYQQNFDQRISVTAGDTVASAIQIGDPVSFDKAKHVIQQSDGVMAMASDQSAMEAKAAADACGIHICPNSAVAVAGARDLVNQGIIGRDQSVVVIATAHGAKFSGAALDYHTNGRWQGTRRNAPRSIDATMDAVRQALA